MKKIILLLIFLITSNIFAQLSLMEINSWAYQLQNINISEIAGNNTFQLVVIDYSSDGTDEHKFTSEQVMQVKSSGKKAISYISIGEAENYRTYWNADWNVNKPSWLGAENPDWEGNFKVRFWEQEWQQIIFTYIDTIISQGFDGIYCDIIDAYYYWMEENSEQPLADSLMIQFVLNIRDHISSKINKDFYIIPQNGDHIIIEKNVSNNLKQKYFNAIDGIGVEDVFFYGDLDNDNVFKPETVRIEVLKEYLDAGKNVFSVEYLTNDELIRQYKEAISGNNFIPYVTTRELNILNAGIILATGLQKGIIPIDHELSQNYPNPFNPETVIGYTIGISQLPVVSNTELKVFDILGREIAVLINEEQKPGTYRVTFDGSNLSSGIYFYTLKAGNYFSIKRAVLLK